MKTCVCSSSSVRPSTHKNTPKVAAVSKETSFGKKAGVALVGLAASLSLAGSVSAVRLPPINNDPNRCDRGFVGNTIGQANAVSDTVLDLRKCVFSGKDLSGKTLSGALLSDADLSNTNLREAVFSKAYAEGATFEGADMSNSVLDRVDFNDANLKNAKLVNAVITGTTFDGTNLEGVDFEDALIGSQDANRLCRNPTLVGDSRYQVGCRISK